MEWKKAGGQLLHEKVSQEREAAAQRRARRDNIRSGGVDGALHGSQRGSDNWQSQDDDLVSVVFSLVEKLF